jgi:hypothetical protein
MIGSPCNVRIALSIKVIVPILFQIEFGVSSIYHLAWREIQGGRNQCRF